MNSTIACAISIFKHKYYVWVAGRRLGVPIWQLITHDLSKFSSSEFPYYRKAYFENDSSDFDYGWLNHQNNNQHHPEFWVVRTIHPHQGNRLSGMEYKSQTLDMPHKYVLEMVADWLAASIRYTGSWDARKWIKENIGKIPLSDNTFETLQQILVGIDGGIFL